MNASTPFLTHGEWVMAILTATYVGLTGFYAWVSHRTLKTIQKQAETNRLQFEKQLTVARDTALAAQQSAQAIVIRSGVHRAMAKLGIETPKGVHAGVHAFRHGVTSELLEAGTPIHVVTRMMRHADSAVTLQHYAHVVGDAERVASEKYSQRIGQNITQLESTPQLESKSAAKSA